MSTTGTDADAPVGTAAVREILAARGLRRTHQRVAVMTLLRACGVHLSVAEIAEQLEASGAAMDLTTVYRTLTTLSEAGLVHALAVPDQATSYGLTEQAHHHALCTRCGAMTDIATELLDPVLDRIGQVNGFALAGAHVTVHGLCPDCRPDA